jgi:hypothetical protein
VSSVEQGAIRLPLYPRQLEYRRSWHNLKDVTYRLHKAGVGYSVHYMPDDIEWTAIVTWVVRDGPRSGPASYKLPVKTYT